MFKTDNKILVKIQYKPNAGQQYENDMFETKRNKKKTIAAQ